MARSSSALIIDEVQKAPPLFDALKYAVDQKRTPGKFFITGSTAFSSKVGIRESLTGRIGLLELHPMTIRELHQKSFLPFTWKISANRPPTAFKNDQVIQAAESGGMPVPAFLRDPTMRSTYWTSWLETTLYRDLSLLFKRGYDADFAFRLLYRMSYVMREGGLVSLKVFREPARKVRNYLSAMEDIFLVRRIACHPDGIGTDTWIFFDSGLAAHLMEKYTGESVQLSLIRHFLWNEWSSQHSAQGKRFERTYYKSAQGAPVDAIIQGIPLRIVSSLSDITQRLKIIERPLLGVMKKLNLPLGFIVGPVDTAYVPPKGKGVGVLPWGFFS